jgi:glycosyltransferase involved in cell wall biosynthesis
MTCRSVLRSAAAKGFATSLHSSRIDGVPETDLAVYQSTPEILHRVPHKLVKAIFAWRCHRSYLRDITDSEIAYIWLSAPLPVFEALNARGIPIVTEAVNTHMAAAKARLDRAYDRLGLKPAHGITEARIRDQNERYARCSTIFAPSPATEAALRGSPLENRFIPSSYGTWVPRNAPDRAPKGPGEDVTFLFVGRVCVRKGIQHLIEAWKDLPANIKLRIVGDVEPEIAGLYGDLLNSGNISHTGFTPDLVREYASADVFVHPSLEEGDSIVTYEAAANGLPILASDAGAGRFGAETGATVAIDPEDVDALRARIAQFAASEELRRDWASKARNQVSAYDWSLVGPRRFRALADFFGFRESEVTSPSNSVFCAPPKLG